MLFSPTRFDIFVLKIELNSMSSFVSGKIRNLQEMDNPVAHNAGNKPDLLSILISLQAPA